MKATKSKNPWESDDRLSLLQKTFLNALLKSLGIVTDAVRLATTADFPLSRSSHYTWLKENAVYKEYVLDIEYEAKDFGESKLFQLMRGTDVKRTIKRKDKNGEAVVETETYNVPPDRSAVIYFNKTKNRDRGYAERVEITGKDGEIIQMGMSRIVINVKDPDPGKNG